jgi:cobalt/nickel transport system permease protein
LAGFWNFLGLFQDEISEILWKSAIFYEFFKYFYKVFDTFYTEVGSFFVLDTRFYAINARELSMHIPDGFLNGEINIATYAASALICGYSIRKCEKGFGEKQVPLLGVTAAFIFAAQMINFPIAVGTSGHFLGAAMAAILMGPYAACVIMTMVLIIQCLGFADGGLTALGSNIFNMGIIGGFGSYYIFTAIKKILPKSHTSFMIAASITSWLSIMLASGFCALELALSGTVEFAIVFPAMLSVHAIIGIGEAIITSTVILIIHQSRPDLVSMWKHAS